MVHHSQCINAKRLQAKDPDRFIPVEWSEESHQHLFESGIVLTIKNTKGVLARVAGELATMNVDIRHVDMDDEIALETTDLRFIILVHDLEQLEASLRNLRRIPTVVRATRIMPLQ